jgi:RNA polymerase sigma-70 factor (ECF subfamily)
MPDFTDRSDESLVAAAVAGDRAAFAALLERHYARIHGLAWQLTGSRTDADDVAQDVCCTLVEKIATFRGQAKFTTWLTGITFNACRDWGRRRRSFLGLTRRLADFTALHPPRSGESDLHDALWLKSAVAALKPAYREAVVLVAGQQLTHAEAAEILGVKESTISWRMHEVRRMLSEQG